MKSHKKNLEEFTINSWRNSGGTLRGIFEVLPGGVPERIVEKPLSNSLGTPEDISVEVLEKFPGNFRKNSRKTF